MSRPSTTPGSAWRSTTRSTSRRSSQALLGGEGTRLPNFFVEGGLGYDPNLAPHAYDPDLARALLTEAGYPDGFETALAYTTAEREDVVQAIAGMLDEVGVTGRAAAGRDGDLQRDLAGSGGRPAALRHLAPAVRPLHPAQPGRLEPGVPLPLRQPQRADPDRRRRDRDRPEKRAAIYRELGRVLHDEPAAIYLFGLTSFYGVAADVPAWTPRPDDYIIPTAR